VDRSDEEHRMADQVIVVGAGLSGLAAAYRLQKTGAEVIVLERASGACLTS